MLVVTLSTLNTNADVDALVTTVLQVAPLLADDDHYHIIAVSQRANVRQHLVRECKRIHHKIVTVTVFTQPSDYTEMTLVNHTLRSFPGETLCTFVEVGDTVSKEHLDQYKAAQGVDKHYVLRQPHTDVWLPCYAATVSMWLTGLQAVPRWLESQWRYVVPTWWYASTTVTQLDANSTDYRSVYDSWVAPKFPAQLSVPSWQQASASQRELMQRALWPILITAMLHDGVSANDMSDTLSLGGNYGSRMDAIFKHRQLYHWCRDACIAVYHQLETHFKQGMKELLAQAKAMPGAADTITDTTSDTAVDTAVDTATDTAVDTAVAAQ